MDIPPNIQIHKGDRKKRDNSLESTCSPSSNIKDELPNAKEKSNKREKRIGVLLDRIHGKKYGKHGRKEVRAKSKGFKFNGIVLMTKEKHTKQKSQRMVMELNTLQ